MPLTKKGEEIESAMKKQYGAKKGEQVFYASRNAGTISGVDSIVSKITKKPINLRADRNTYNSVNAINEATNG